MSQRSITSFFSKPSQKICTSAVEKKEKSPESIIPEDSPIKQQRKRRRIYVDEEDEQRPSSTDSTENEIDDVVNKENNNDNIKVDKEEDTEVENSFDGNDKNTDIQQEEVETIKEECESENEKKPEKKPKSSEKSKAKSSKKKKKAKISPKKSERPKFLDNIPWKAGDPAPYEALAATLSEIEQESGRLKCIEYLSNLLRLVMERSPNDTLPTLYLSMNQLAPASEGLELGVGESLLFKALAQATGRSVNQIKAEAKSKGDLGVVAEASRNTQKTMFQPKRLTIQSVYSGLRQIAEMTGNSSMNKKIDKIRFLLASAKDSEAKFVIRALTGKLRIGLAEQSVLQALASACDSENSQLAADIVKTTYAQCPSFDKIIPNLIKYGVDNLLDHCPLEPGMPLKPMLAHPTKGIDEVLKRFDAKIGFTCEHKYDGERAQIHLLEDGTVKIYSRNQEDNTIKYPDIVSRIKELTKVKTAIIDSEAVAWDTNLKRILPFQMLSTRKKKVDNVGDIKVQVCVYAFDMLYVDGESLVTKPLKERRDRLRQSFEIKEGEMVLATGEDAHDADTVAVLLDKAIKDSCEGLMLKALDDTYEIAKRSHSWLKLKKDYLDSAGGDTLDLIVVGAYDGTGKRTGRFGGFLLACYDSENEEYQTICKLGTGFSDEQLDKFTEILKPLIIETPKAYYNHKMSPDHWLEGQIVWEVKAADLSISPAHTAAAGLVHEEKGVSLRFPRFVRVRDDKKPEDATSAEQVAGMYKSQEQVQALNRNEDNSEDY